MFTAAAAAIVSYSIQHVCRKQPHGMKAAVSLARNVYFPLSWFYPSPWRGAHESSRKRSYAQLATFGDENGAPSPFPSDGSSKHASRALSNSTLTVHQDGAYMQVLLSFIIVSCRLCGIGELTRVEGVFFLFLTCVA